MTRGLRRAKKKPGKPGRPKGSGAKPREEVRRNRAVIMVTDRELAALKRLAKASGVPVGTKAYEIIAKALRRSR